jgi:DNA polymerase-1
LSGAAPAPHHVYLIDASGFIFRAYHALPPLSRADGTPTSAVLGFVNMVLKLLEGTDADHVAAVFDSARVSFRNEIFDQYKANRTEPPDDLVPQFALVREACDALSIPKVEAPNFEADDLIATYAREAVEAGATVTIVSSDKDLMQLVCDGRVVMFDPIKEKPIGAAEVQEKFGVPPEKVIDVQALCGDSVDNVPGVPGIGVKTAAELINTYGTLENLLEHAAEIKQPARRQRLLDNRENALLSKRLVTLDTHVKLPCPLSDLALKAYDRAKLIGFLQANDFRKVIQRLEQGRYARTGGNGAAAPAAPIALPTADDFAGRKYATIEDEAALAPWLDTIRRDGVVALEVLTTQPEGAMLRAVGIGLAVASQAAAGGSLDPQDRAQREVRGACARRLRHRAGAARLHAAHVLRARRHAARAGSRRPRGAAPQARDDQVQGSLRQRQGADRLRRGPGRACRALRRRMRRRGAAAAPPP